MIVIYGLLGGTFPQAPLCL